MKKNSKSSRMLVAVLMVMLICVIGIGCKSFKPCERGSIPVENAN
mgnify:CR=1 FL=1